MSALFVDHLTVMDFSFVDAKRGILGDSWIVGIVLHGELDEQGMLFDFGHIKKQIKQFIDLQYDHKLLIPLELPALTKLFREPFLQVSWQDIKGRHFQHKSPGSAVLLLPCKRVTPASISPLIEEDLKHLLPGNITGIEVHLKPETIDGCYYHYSHGLKKHLGNCQRIAHGHRSRIEIYRDGQRDPALELEWTRKWQDIYIGTQEDLSGTSVEAGIKYHHFSYEAQQGPFELKLPGECTYLISTDSTVELLAEHILSILKAKHPRSHFKIKAFEGILKGAFAEG